MMRHIINFVMPMMVLASLPIRADVELIENVDVQFNVEVSDALVLSTNNYLDRFVNKEASAENRRLAEDFLRSVYAVYSAQCRFLDASYGRTLLCELISRRTIRAINVKNLPVSLLEGELKRALSIEAGQSIDVDNTVTDLLAAARGRVETFLRKNGFYGAQVVVNIDAPANKSFADITIDIVGGVFARVNSVIVSGDPPIAATSIRKQFSRMGFSFDRIIESISIGTLGWYSRKLENETTQAIQERLAKMGYVQSQVRVSHYWIDGDDESAMTSCRSRNGKPPSYRCINLRVHVEKGPHFRWQVNVKDQLSISSNGLQRFIGSIFSVDQLSRATTSIESDERALDQVIIDEELENQTTFITARNVDEQELTESAADITDFLVSRGYVNAEVVPSLVQEDENNVLITFDVYANKPFFVDSVKMLPQKFARFVDEDYLESLVSLRGFTENGSLSYNVIDAAKEDIKNRLRMRGYDNLTINVDMESQSNGAVGVTFYVSGDARQVLDEIVVVNGYDDISDEILPYLHNCDNFTLAKRRDHKRTLCAQSSFVSAMVEDDALRLADHYQTNGYLYAKVASEVVRDANGNRLIFTLYDSRLDEKSLEPLTQQTINDIIVSGNSKTSTSAIKRLFPKERKSKTRDPIAIKKGLALLRESGRFSRIDHKIMFGQENSDDAYFLLQVAERPSLSLDTSIAFSTDQLFSLEAELEESNLFSSMLRLKTTLALGLFWGRQSIFTNKLIWPAIFGYPLRFTITAPNIVYEDRLHLAKPSRRLRTTGSMRLEWRLSSRVTPYLEYLLIYTQEDRQARAHGSFSTSISTLDGLIPTMQRPGKLQGVLKPGISFINLDDPFDPHSGFDINLWTDLSGGPLLGRPPFVNLGVQNRFFIPLGPLTLALQATFMRVFVDPSNDNFDRLRDANIMDKLGGDRSVRGYEQDAIGITEYPYHKTNYAGYLSNLANVELRFPITKKSAIGNFSGAVFVDEGMLLACGELFGCGTNKSVKRAAFERGFGLAVGAALRYSLPVGPISLDYGVSPITGDNRVHVLFGYSF